MLRKKPGKKYEISFAAGGSGNYINLAIEWNGLLDVKYRTKQSDE
jgi:hypothetical protein